MQCGTHMAHQSLRVRWWCSYRLLSQLSVRCAPREQKGTATQFTGMPVKGIVVRQAPAAQGFRHQLVLLPPHARLVQPWLLLQEAEEVRRDL